jgi:DNA-binding GntR family transcriptional regulator
VLDHEGDTHLYVQIADIIRAKITNGELSPGDPVPSEAAIQSEFGVARTTARRAFHLLREEGLIYTIQGEGTFVGSPGDARRDRRDRRTPPMYRQIANDVIDRIKAGDYRPRRAIPSETTFVQEYEVARETVRRAMNVLRDEHWIYTVPQRGSYVCAEEEWPKP